MRTLSVRFALLYSLLSTLTLLSLLTAGYYLLKRHLASGLDMINRVEFEQVRAALQSDPVSHNASELGARMRIFAPNGSSVLFFEIYSPDDQLLFRSASLGAHSLPSESTEGADARVDGIGSIRVGTFPLPAGKLRIATSSAVASELMNTYAGISLFIVSLTLLASLITGILLSKAILHPVRVIRETAVRISSDNLSMRIPVPDGENEISSLAQLLNEMFDRLQSSFDQIRRFTAETSHELKTPLSLIRLQIERLLLEDSLTSPQQETLHVAMEEVENIDRFIERLLLFSRVEAQAITAELRRQNTRSFIEGFAEDARTLTEHRGMRFDLHISGDREVEFDARMLNEVLLNLIDNAVNVSPPAGLITLRSDFTIDAWRLAVEDEGPGVPEADRERIFDRFVRLQNKEVAATKGSGLGLSICRSLVKLHGGTIRAETGARAGGLRMTCEIPVAKVAPSSQPLRVNADSSSQVSSID